MFDDVLDYCKLLIAGAVSSILFRAVLVLAVASLPWNAQARDWRVSGFLSGQFRGFWQEPLDPIQADTDLSVATQPEFYTESENGLDSFTLLAIPFFVLAGQLMNKGGIAIRLIDFAKALVGRFPGGLAFVNVISNLLFGAISGSAVTCGSG